MSRTVDDGFSEFVELLTPKYSEPETAEIDLVVIERCLNEAFDLHYMAPYGSTGYGTNVAGMSARDCFAVMSKERLLEDSALSLERVKKALDAAFPNTTITEGRPVIAVPFGDSRAECHHIVPAFPMGTRGAFDTFGIPGPDSRWIEACPGGHSAWINRVDAELGGRLKPFVRIAKAWNYADGEPLWSFYLEHCAVDFLMSKSTGSVSVVMKDFFLYLLRRRIAPFRTSEGSAEAVYGTSIASKFDAMDRLRHALELAEKACFSERRGNPIDAFYWWRKLFAYRFPAY